jgi:hypothetical protein
VVTWHFYPSLFALNPTFLCIIIISTCGLGRTYSGDSYLNSRICMFYRIVINSYSYSVLYLLFVLCGCLTYEFFSFRLKLYVVFLYNFTDFLKFLSFWLLRSSGSFLSDVCSAELSTLLIMLLSFSNIHSHYTNNVMW